MATTTLQDPLATQQLPQSGIVGAAMPTPAPSPAPTPAPAPVIAPAVAASPAPSPVGIVGAQSQQLGNPTAWNVDDSQTVEGRIAHIIQSGSPLQEQAKTAAMEQMNARGLGNSSLAITAGQDALYRSALPIAQSDAATFAKAAGYNADQGNQFAVRNTDSENQFRLQDKTIAGQQALQAQQGQTQKDLAQISRETQVELSKLDASQKATADAIAQQNQKVIQTNQQAAGAFQTAMSAVSAIQNNNNMDSATKTQGVAQVWSDLQTQLKVLGSVAQLDLTSQLNFANMPGFNASGQYIGFSGAPGTTAAAPPPPGGPGAPPGLPPDLAAQRQAAVNAGVNMAMWDALHGITNGAAAAGETGPATSAAPGDSGIGAGVSV